MTRRSTVAIMQPTYLPWMGYFDLMDQCDVFILLDSVQFEKRSWQQRNRVKTPEGQLWLTVPVLSKGRRDQKICEVQIDRRRHFEETHIKSVQHFYGKARFFGHYIGDFSTILQKRHDYLADLTIELISWFKEVLSIQTPLIRSSTLGIQGKKVELLYAICRHLNAECYVSPPGSRNYIEENNLFAANGIELRYHRYTSPCYMQLYGDFLPSLSVLDLLLNEGDRSLSIIKSGSGSV